MTASASWTLQKGIFITLTSHPQLVSLLKGPHVYDYAPQNASYPYLSIGKIVVNDMGTFTEPGEEHIITLRAWSNNCGKREIYAILDAVREALHYANIKLDGHHLISLQHHSSQAEKDERGEGYNGSASYRAVTEPAL